MAKLSGKFIVSLDFELMWGVRDIATLRSYGENLRGVQEALPKILEFFIKYDISGTFATVGLLFFKNKEALINNLPGLKPQYADSNLSPYGDYITKNVGVDSKTDPYHFAPQLIELIRNTAKQEIGTHTFSHFYCLEQGQTLNDFREDLKTAINVANEKGIAIKSIVFPRNQVNIDYLETCVSLGIVAYRSNENSWIYSARSGKNESFLRRFFRLVDTYINLSGHHCYSDEYMKKNAIVNIPSSRFLRPYSPNLKPLEWLRLRRIKKSMTYAAKNNLLYHLWWHPHNFGVHQDQNFSFLEKILKHYNYLNKEHDFKSYTMYEFAQLLLTRQ